MYKKIKIIIRGIILYCYMFNKPGLWDVRGGRMGPLFHHLYMYIKCSLRNFVIKQFI